MVYFGNSKSRIISKLKIKYNTHNIFTGTLYIIRKNINLYAVT